MLVNCIYVSFRAVVKLISNMSFICIIFPKDKYSRNGGEKKLLSVMEDLTLKVHLLPSFLENNGVKENFEINVTLN